MHELQPYLPYILRGIGVTVEISLLGLAVSFPAAFILGFCRNSRQWYLRRPAAFIVEFFRGTSALVQLFWAYYALPLLHVHLASMTAAVLVLGLNEGSYTSEIVRGGLNSIPRGQVDAAVAVGFSPWHRFTRVVLPQALPLMAPGFGNTVVTMVKFTSLVSLVTIPDLAFRAQSVEASINQPTAIYSAVLVAYFVITFAFACLMRLLEAYLRRRFGVPRLPARAAARRLSSLPLPDPVLVREGD